MILLGGEHVYRKAHGSYMVSDLIFILLLNSVFYGIIKRLAAHAVDEDVLGELLPHLTVFRPGVCGSSCLVTAGSYM